jgi:hypothetical protein
MLQSDQHKVYSFVYIPPNTPVWAIIKFVDPTHLGVTPTLYSTVHVDTVAFHSHERKITQTCTLAFADLHTAQLRLQELQTFAAAASPTDTEVPHPSTPASDATPGWLGSRRNMTPDRLVGWMSLQCMQLQQWHQVCESMHCPLLVVHDCQCDIATQAVTVRVHVHWHGPLN